MIDSNIAIELIRLDILPRLKSMGVCQDCQLLGINDAALINQQVQSIWQNKGFTDPFANTPKRAKVVILRPSQLPTS